MTYAMRFAYSSFALLAAPYAIPILRSVSHSSGNGKSYFSANFALSATESKLTPRSWTFLLSYWSARSRNPEPSAVHPGVSAFG